MEQAFQELLSEGKGGERRDEKWNNQSQGIIQASKVPQEVQDAVRLPCPLSHVLIQVEVMAAIFEQVVRLSFFRKVDPRSWQRVFLLKRVPSMVQRLSQLKVVGFVFERVLVEVAFDVSILPLADLLGKEPRLLPYRLFVVLALLKDLIFDQQLQSNRAKEVSLGLLFSDALISSRVEVFVPWVSKVARH